uniref:NADH dehydrogenase subunit 4L n=1 Tax=Paratenuisentis ambiguus TaxID=185730 RepID=K0J9V3_PARAB|nr:NADH dehydrogenase subunit 4L [Paratenuisentis ambiguus]CCA94484.2 NADH dehydrogenase subunit 4L [Paratenuisentis ambiguus]
MWFNLEVVCLVGLMVLFGSVSLMSVVFSLEVFMLGLVLELSMVFSSFSLSIFLIFLSVVVLGSVASFIVVIYAVALKGGLVLGLGW